MQKIIILVVFAFTVSFSFSQQLPFNSQYMFNNYLINPAVAGTKDYNPVMLTFRDQWAGLNGAPFTQTLSLHGSWVENMGFGGIIMNDITGPVRQTGLQLSYAYHFSISEKSKLSLGLAGMYYQHVLDKDLIELDDPNDNAMMDGKEKTFIPEASFGVYYYTEKYYAGFSAPQLFQNKVDYNKDNQFNIVLVRHYFLTSGYKFEINKDVDFEPSFLLKAIIQAPLQLDINAKVFYKEIVWLGVSYRHKESIVLMLGTKTRENNFSVGYSYDATLTNIRKYSSGSHELFISLSIPDKFNKVKDRSKASFD